MTIQAREKIYYNGEEKFISSEPLKPLCDETCSGICSYCGIDKITHCSCEDQKDTSVWDKLKNIDI